MAAKGRRNVKRYSERAAKPLIRFRFKIIILIFILSFAGCFTIYMMSVNVENSENSVGKVIYASDSKAEELQPTESGKKEIINPVPASAEVSSTYLGKCAFVGDSIMVGLSDYQFVSSKNVVAQVGLNIDKINTEMLRTGRGEKTALEALKDLMPENIYILLGSNGIEWLTEEEMTGYYSEFVDSVMDKLPDAEIFILAVPPVTSEREKADEAPISNSDIDRFNSSLLEMANQKGIHFVDINTALKGNDGKFPEGDAAADGMHFTKDTYQIMVDYILTHTVQ